MIDSPVSTPEKSRIPYSNASLNLHPHRGFHTIAGMKRCAHRTPGKITEYPKEQLDDEPAGEEELPESDDNPTLIYH